MPGCDVCDFRDRPEECHALATGHAPFCDLIRRGRSDYRELVRRLTLGVARRPSAPSPSPRAAQAENPHLLRLARAGACDHSAGIPAGCGCAAKRVCLAGKGRGPGGGPGAEVYFSECLGCELGGPAHEFGP